MPIWSVVYRVLATPRSVALQADQLRAQTRLVEQFGASSVEQWEQIDVQLVFCFVCRFVFNILGTKPLSRPFAAVAVAGHTRQVVRVDSCAEFPHNVIG